MTSGIYTYGCLGRGMVGDCPAEIVYMFGYAWIIDKSRIGTGGDKGYGQQTQQKCMFQIDFV